MEKFYLTKKSQAWALDLIIASVIFTVAIVFFYLYALNAPNEAQETAEALFYDGRIVSDSILSEGYWTPGGAVTIGILSQNKINETKLKDFNSLDYETTKQLFSTTHNYYFFLNEIMVIDGVDVPGIGKNPSNPKNLVKITRFTIYKNKPTTAYFYMWD